MARTALVLLAVFMVASMVVAAHAQTPKPSKDPGRPSDKGPDPDGNQTTEPSKSRREPGRLAVTEDTVHGRYVSFDIDLAECRVTDFQAYNTSILAAIRLPATDCETPRGGPASRFEMRGEATEIRIHDAPNALLQFTGRNGSVMVTPFADLILTPLDRGYNFTIGNLSGRLASDQNLSLENGTLQASDGRFMLHPASGSSPERRAVFEAIQRGRVGAEADVMLENGSLATEVLTYDNVTLEITRPRDDRFSVRVDAAIQEGRVFVTNFDPSVWDPARMRVDYADVDEDGTHRGVVIREADSLDEILDLAADKDPAYFAYEDEEGWHAAVAVPHFSVHVFQVVGLPLQVVPLLLYGIVIGGLFLAAGGLGIVLERRTQRARGR